MDGSTPAPRSDPATWIDAHGAALHAYAQPRMRDQQTAEDLVQETFLAALKAGNFRGDAQERTGLVAILSNPPARSAGVPRTVVLRAAESPTR